MYKYLVAFTIIFNILTTMSFAEKKPYHHLLDGDLDANTMSIAAANATKQFQAMAKIFVLGLGDVYNKLLGPKKTEKDF